MRQFSIHTRLNQTVTAFPQITVLNPIDIIHSLMASPSDILDERLRIVLHLPLDYECHIAVICNDFSLFDKWNEEDVHKFVQFSIINVANDILRQAVPVSLLLRPIRNRPCC